jgi:hypothetical protein
MKENDRVGFIKFNKNCDIIFDLNEKGKNELFLRNSIDNLRDEM